MRRVMVISLFLLSAGLGVAPATGPATQATTKVLTVPLTDKAAKALCQLAARRMGVPDRPLTVWRDVSPTDQRPKAPPAGQEGEATFDLYIPSGLGGRLAGLVVYISPGDQAALPSNEFKKVLDARGLAWIAARESGNNRAPVWRLYLAAEAVRQARAVLPLDDGRIYAAGLSGGGKMACIAGELMPDTFSGILACCGPAHFKNVQTGPGENIAGFRPNADAQQLSVAKTHPFVLLTGDNDFNLGPTEAIGKAMLADGFALTKVMVVPGLGHALPDGENFDKALTDLEAPALDNLAKLATTALTFERQNKLGKALLAYHQIASRDPKNNEAANNHKRLTEMYEKELAALEPLTGQPRTVALGKLRARWGDLVKPELK